MKKMSATFRVEAFIIPSLNREIKTSENIIDDVKVANKLREGVSMSNSKLESINEDSEYSDHSIFNKSTASDKEISNLPTIQIGIIETEEAKTNNEALLINNCDSNRKNPSVPTINPVPELNVNEYLSSANYDMSFCYDGEKNKILNSVNVNFSQSDSDSNSTGDVVINEPIYDIPYNTIEKSQRETSKFRKKFETGEFISPMDNKNRKLPALPKPLAVRSSSLMSIDESPEDCDRQLCCHGFRSGCTSSTQRPEQITEEIFEVNWMKRLENLRARESVIKEKEAMLFDRERLLFKKERELRILERLIKDKLKHVELCSKRQRHQNTDSLDFHDLWKNSESTSGSRDSLEKKLSSFENLEIIKFEGKPGASFKEVILGGQIINKNTNAIDEKINNENNHRIKPELMKTAAKSSDSITSESSTEGKKSFIKLKNPLHSRDLLHTVPESCAPVSLARSMQNTRCISTGYSSIRRRRKPKISYDDLDSTLSADIGDSSFVVTSKIFDPVTLKKPQAFTRSMSDRKPSPIVEEEKVLKRISENILVSKNKDTKFQNYGLIDSGKVAGNQNTEINDNSQSYLNLERGIPFRVTTGRKTIDAKDRPTSWNEEQNEWLQKKRMAYNSTIRRMPTEDFEKENLQKKPEAKKKLSVVKKFSIFR